MFRIILFVLCFVSTFIANIPPQLGREMINVKTLKSGGEVSNIVKKLSFMLVVLVSMLMYSLYMNHESPISYTELILGYVNLMFCSLRLTCYYVLGEFFTYDLMIKTDHKLISAGPYRYLIHPSYTGQVGAFITYIFFTKAYVICILLPLVFNTIIRRIKLEEDMMYEGFGEEYKEYAGNRWRLIPFLY